MKRLVEILFTEEQRKSKEIRDHIFRIIDTSAARTSSQYTLSITFKFWMTHKLDAQETEANSLFVYTSISTGSDLVVTS